MNLEVLRIERFRNIAMLEFFPHAAMNFIVGSNGSGKTSLLEALSVLSTLRSFRDNKKQALVQFGKPQAFLHASVTDGVSHATVDMEIADTRFTRVAMNGKNLKSGSQYLRQNMRSHAVVFHPSDHELIRLDARFRRRYFDHLLAAEDTQYGVHLRDYARALVQRNALLRDTLQTSHTQQMIRSLGTILIERGTDIIFTRLKWIEKCNRLLPILWENAQYCSLQYSVVCSHDRDGIHHFLSESFKKVQQAEVRARVTLSGPHRDDVHFFFHGKPLRYASQGEGRLFLLALKLAEVQLYCDTGRKPLFLLDDFSSELDSVHRSMLMHTLRSQRLQVFVTTTDRESIPSDAQVVEMCYGNLRGGRLHDN